MTPSERPVTVGEYTTSESGDQTTQVWQESARLGGRIYKPVARAKVCLKVQAKFHVSKAIPHADSEISFSASIERILALIAIIGTNLGLRAPP